MKEGAFMKMKKFLPLLLSLALLSMPLSGCSTPAEETDTATPQPNITTDENGVSTAADLDIVSDDGEYLTLWQTPKHQDTDFFYEIPLEGLTCVDQEGNSVSIDQLSADQLVTLTFTKDLSQQVYEQVLDTQLRYTFTLSQDEVVSLTLQEEPAQPVTQPFGDLTADQLTELAVQTDNFDPPGFTPLSSPALEEMVAQLAAIRAVSQPNPDLQPMAGSPSTLRLTYTDGRQVLVGVNTGANFQLTIQTREETQYYRVRYLYLEEIQNIMSDAM